MRLQIWSSLWIILFTLSGYTITFKLWSWSIFVYIFANLPDRRLKNLRGNSSLIINYPFIVRNYFSIQNFSYSELLLICWKKNKKKKENLLKIVFTLLFKCNGAHNYLTTWCWINVYRHFWLKIAQKYILELCPPSYKTLCTLIFLNYY